MSEAESPTAPAAASAVLLPHRPRTRDWIAAGICAGLILGAAELVVLRLAGVLLDPGTAVVFGLAPAFAVAALCLGLGVPLLVSERPPTHSEMVAFVLATLLFIPALGVLLGFFSGAVTPGVASVGFVLLSVILATAVGVLGARLARRLEGAGWWLSGPALWAFGSGLLAAQGVVAPENAPAALAPMVAAAVLFAAVVYVASVALRARRAARGVPLTWPRTLLIVGLFAGVAMVGERALPFVLLDRDVPPLVPGPPNVLVLGFGPSAALAPSRPGAPQSPLVALYATDGVRFTNVDADASPAALAPLLRLLDGRPLLAALHERGYATAVFQTDPARPTPDGSPENVRRLGGAALLRASASFTAGGSLVLALGDRLLGALGLDATLRGPDALRGEAHRWLVDWRTRRAPVPFALVVDYETTGSTTLTATVDAQLDQWQQHLHDLQIHGDTLVLVVTTAPSGRIRLIGRPPGRLRVRGRGSVQPRPVEASAFATAILDAALDPEGRQAGLPRVLVSADVESER